MLAIASRMDAARTRRFVERMDLDVPVALDVDGKVYETYNWISGNQGVAPYPREFVLGPGGEVLYGSGRHDPRAVLRAVEAARP